jgi:hypothetical protein
MHVSEMPSMQGEAANCCDSQRPVRYRIIGSTEVYDAVLIRSQACLVPLAPWALS